MQIEKLVRMANQIGAFFASEPDHAVAVEGVASHLRRFWEPRMRGALLAHLAATGGDGLSPLVLEAVTVNRERLAGGVAPPAPQDSGTRPAKPDAST